MILFEYLRFYWPMLMIGVFVLFGGQRVNDKGRFCLYGTLVLFGISRLVSADLLPTIVGLIPGQPIVSRIVTVHWIFQFGAAICGVYALLGLEKVFSVRSQSARSVDTPEIPPGIDQGAGSETP
jgi:hypothetical protein